MNEMKELNAIVSMKEKALVAIMDAQHQWDGGVWDTGPNGAEYSASEKASECGEFALAYIEVGDFAAALERVRQAVALEREFGDAPAWSKARVAVEELIAMQDEFDCN